MKVHEVAKIHTEFYPFAEKLNPILHEIIIKRSYREDMGAIMTDWNIFDIPEFQKIGDFATNIIRGWSRDIYTPARKHGLRLNNLWGQWYRKGDYQVSHAHQPNQWSFVYYVNVPKGSSPLVFTESRKKIYPREGMILIWPSWIRHEVPPNKCEGRSIIAGNYYYLNEGDQV
tara:strand:- start:210 stop:725 length:516 start_codon:yes stop_codon:yes gene_type:complete